MTLSVANGILNLGWNVDSSLNVSGQGSSLLTIEGDQSLINQALDGLYYTADPDFYGSDTLSITADDLSGSADGTDHTTTSSVSITVLTPPSLSVPGDQVMAAFGGDAGGAVTFSAANGSAITVGDSNSAVSILQVALSDNYGNLDLADTSGITFDEGSNNSQSFTIEGTVADLNNALDGLTYQQESFGSINPDTLTVSVDDLTGSGYGGIVSSEVGIDIPPPSISVTSGVSGSYGGEVDPGIFLDDLTGDELELTLQVTGNEGGSLWSPLTGQGGTTLVLQDTASNLNNDLQNLEYSYGDPDGGTDTILISVTDLTTGASGSAIQYISDPASQPYLSIDGSNPDVEQDQTASVQLYVSDSIPQMDNFNFTVSSDSPDVTGAGVSYSGGNDTATFTWTPGTQNSGNYTFTISVSDGFSTASMQLEIGVIDETPVFEPISDQSVTDGSALSFDAQANCPDSSIGVNYSVDTSIPGVYIDPNSGQMWIGTNNLPTGVYPVTVMATNSLGESAAQTFNVDVTSDATNPATLNTGSNQSTPTIASDALGDYIAAWYGVDSQTGAAGIYGQAFSPSGVAEGGNFLIAQTVGGYGGAPSIAMNGAGKFVVSWWDNGSVYAEQFAAYSGAAGGPTSTSAVQQVNPSGTAASEPSVAIGSDGAYVIAWYGDDTSGNDGVYAEQFSSSGAASGSVVQVVGLGASQPSVVMDANDNFLVAWNWSGSAYAMEFAADGSVLQTAFEVAGSESVAALAAGMGPNGQFAIAWSTGDNGGSVEAVNYTAACQAVENTPIIVDSNQPGDDNTSQPLGVAIDGSGYFMVTWYDGISGGSYPLGTEDAIYSPSGAVAQSAQWLDAINPNQLVTDSADYWFNYQDSGGAAVSTGDSGAFAAAWTHPAWDGNSNAIYTQPLTVVEPLALAAQQPGLLTITAGAAATTLDVSSAFVENGADDPLVYSVSTDIESSLVTANFTDSVLSLGAPAGVTGLANLTIRATDTVTGNFVEFPLAVTVAEPPPMLASIADQTIDEGRSLTFTASATGADPLIYSLAATNPDGSTPPAGATIDPTTGKFIWKPANVVPGSYEFTVVVSDPDAAPQSVSRTFNVQLDSQPISILGITNQSAAADAPFAIGLTASEPGFDPSYLSFGLADGAPQGAAITPQGNLTWTPTDSQAAKSYAISIVVTNTLSHESTTQTMLLTVTPSAAAQVGQIATTSADSFLQQGSDWATTPSQDQSASIVTHAAGTGDATAGWTLSGLDPTEHYDVYVSWPAGANLATNAPFTISDNGVTPTTVQVNQQLPPDGPSTAGQTWQLLGNYAFSSGTLDLRLSDDADGAVAAGAIRVVAAAPQASGASGSAVGSQSIPDVNLTSSGDTPSQTIAISDYFTGDDLTFVAASDQPSLVNAVVVGGALTLSFSPGVFVQVSRFLLALESPISRGFCTV